MIALLKERGYSSVAEMSNVLNVSPMTVRRDLHILHEKQIVEVTHGGARFLTVVTQSLPVAALVAQNKLYQLIMLGGVLQSSSNYFYGSQAIATLQEVYINKLFLATSGLLIPEGLSSSYLSDAEIKQAMIKASRKVILCMDSSKIGRVFLARFAPLDVIDTVLTDSGISDESCEALQKQHVQVIVVPTEGQASFPEREPFRDDVAV